MAEQWLIEQRQRNEAGQPSEALRLLPERYDTEDEARDMARRYNALAPTWLFYAPVRADSP
jgi:hypothetical protein